MLETYSKIFLCSKLYDFILHLSPQCPTWLRIIPCWFKPPWYDRRRKPRRSSPTSLPKPRRRAWRLPWISWIHEFCGLFVNHEVHPVIALIRIHLSGMMTPEIRLFEPKGRVVQRRSGLRWQDSSGQSAPKFISLARWLCVCCWWNKVVTYLDHDVFVLKHDQL